MSATLIFFYNPFLNRIEISVKGDTCVLLGVKGLNSHFLQALLSFDYWFVKKHSIKFHLFSFYSIIQMILFLFHSYFWSLAYNFLASHIKLRYGVHFVDKVILFCKNENFEWFYKYIHIDANTIIVVSMHYIYMLQLTVLI